MLVSLYHNKMSLLFIIIFFFFKNYMGIVIFSRSDDLNVM